MARYQMHHSCFGLPHALHAEQRRADHHLTLALENVVPENDVHWPGFIFDRDEHRAFGGLRSLPVRDDSTRARRTAVRSGLQLARASNVHARQPWAQQCERMAAERKPEPLVIGDDVGAFGRWSELDLRLRKARRPEHLRAPRLDAERFPSGLMTMARQRGERSTGGQYFEL